MTDRLHDALLALKTLRPQGMDLSLSRLTRLLAELGNPQNAIPPVIHVAGTNGKGSTIACLRAILEAANYRCHVYTSPHLIRFNERIRLAGDLISDDYLLELIDEVVRVNSSAEISFFEITTAIAFLAFACQPADVLLLEVGLGGRLDATNVVANPLLTVITTISRDHREWLGHTLAAIAAEKAGIMKAGVPCVIGHQLDWAEQEVLPVFRRKADEVNAPLHLCGQDWFVESGPSGILFNWNGRRKIAPRPNLPGLHQAWNAGAALAALAAQRQFNISDAAIDYGLIHAEWPGRLERIIDGPVAMHLPAGWELWYDGGHNDSGGEMLARQALAWRDADGKPLHLICGMLASRDPLEVLVPLLPLISSLRTFSFDTGPFTETGPAASGRDLAAKIRPAFPAVTFYPSLAEAVSSTLDGAPPGRILVCGTLYAYKDLFNPPQD